MNLRLLRMSEGAHSTSLVHSPFTVELVDTLEGLRALRNEWTALYSTTDGLNPFMTWDWAWQWWQAFGRSSGVVRDQWHILVFRDEQGVIRAIAPLVLTVFGYGWLAVRALRLFGFGSMFVELRTLLVEPGWEGMALQALTNRLLAERHAYHWCVLDGVARLDGLSIQAANEGTAGRWAMHGEMPDYVLHLPATWEALRAGMKRNIKESLRHCYNSLARDKHEWRFEVVADPAELPAALTEFMNLHGARATADLGPEHPNYYEDSRSSAFIQRMAEIMSRDGQFMVCRLRINGVIVASRIAFIAGSSVYLYHSGFNPAWARYSVMTTLTAEIIKMAISRGARLVNLSTWNHVSKTRWGPEEQMSYTLRMTSPTLMGKLMFKVYRRAKGLRQAGQDQTLADANANLTNARPVIALLAVGTGLPVLLSDIILRRSRPRA